MYVHAGGGRAYLANYLCMRDREGRLEVNFGAELLTEPANAREAHELVLAKLTNDRPVESGWTDHRVEIRTLVVEVVEAAARPSGATEGGCQPAWVRNQKVRHSSPPMTAGCSTPPARPVWKTNSAPW
jgi:hypothetical protein